ncbi:MAG: orotate phosphoribosyltransferase [Chloroflexota bacterium]
MFDDDHRCRLLALLREHAVMRGDFVLSSGQRSNFYLDARQVTLMAEGSGLVGGAFLQALDTVDVDAVAGLSVGADPIVTAIAVRAGLAGRSVDGLIVRKEAKQHGAGRRIEGPWRPGLRVAVVDDTSTTGDSSLQAARAVGEEGGHVVGIFQLIDREQGAREAATRAGYSFHAVFTSHEILAD